MYVSKINIYTLILVDMNRYCFYIYSWPTLAGPSKNHNQHQQQQPRTTGAQLAQVQVLLHDEPPRVPVQRRDQIVSRK